MDGLTIDSTVGGFKVSEFSNSIINQQNTFYCQDPATNRILKWFNNGPNVYSGHTNVLNSEQFNMSKWSQEVKKFNTNSYTILSGSSLEISIESTFIYVNIGWPNGTIETKKLTELFLSGTYKLDTNITQGINFIGEYDTLIEQRYLLKDFLILNLGQVFLGKVKIINSSPYDITYSILECSAFDNVTEVPEIINSIIYWGTTLKTDTFISDDIINLASKERLRTIVKDGVREILVNANEYSLIAFPQSWGNINLKVDGYNLVTSNNSPYTTTVVNPANNQPILYNVWRSEHTNLGLISIVTS